MTNNSHLDSNLPDADWIAQRLIEHGVASLGATAIADAVIDLLGCAPPERLVARLRDIPSSARSSPVHSALTAIDTWLAQAREWVTLSPAHGLPIAAVALRGQPSADRFRVQHRCGIIGLDVECERSSTRGRWDVCGTITAPEDAPAGLVVRFHSSGASSVDATLDDLSMFRAQLPAGEYAMLMGSPAQDAVSLASLSLP